MRQESWVKAFGIGLAGNIAKLYIQEVIDELPLTHAQNLGAQLRNHPELSNGLDIVSIEWNIDDLGSGPVKLRYYQNVEDKFDPALGRECSRVPWYAFC